MMCPAFEFQRLDLARAAREIAGAWLAEDDDRRRTRVEVARSVPHDVEQLLEWREYRAEPRRRAGQIELTEGELDRITLPRTPVGGANVPHAMSCKAIAAVLEVSDWTSYYDRELTVDEHWDVYESAREDVPRSMVPDFMGGGR